ncbi:pseudouridine synthase [Flaviaesturariibacter flavus]|uniref:Pseudouridine synthase n=1 Tax=Flaviaesturariibacter flavus TaxID=2502780 RepID=A0A4R1BMX2_9BACT|nr:pseudouridine synthase [Flaviaesturariibacter flavus]TCJ18789.1 pseudouridine synthase [Flaviaesturariibacter flavus]
MPLPFRYFLLHKPHGVLSQFVSPYPQRLLGDLGFAFPEGTHALGRLDLESEGLLLLTTDKRMTKLLFQGAVPHPRVYHVEVKGVPDEADLERLRTGVPFLIEGGRTFTSAPCTVEAVPGPPHYFPSPYKYNPYVPTSWLKISLTEGRFHQVRKMVRVVGHPCIRLLRTSISGLELGDLQPGAVRELDAETFFGGLGIPVPD